MFFKRETTTLSSQTFLKELKVPEHFVCPEVGIQAKFTA